VRFRTPISGNGIIGLPIVIVMSSKVLSIAFASFLFASSLFAPVISVEIGGLARGWIESSLSIIQSLVFTGALFHATINTSKEDQNTPDNFESMIAEQAMGRPTASQLLKEESVVFDLLTTHEYYFHRDKQKSRGAERQNGKNVFCEKDCASRSRLPSNPKEQVVGSGERW
jgi:hypothetical protein